MDPDEPGRLPSDRPEPCGPGGQDALTVRVRSLARHPVACREPRRPRQRPTGRFRLSLRLPCLPRRARVFCNARSRRSMPDLTGKDASFRLLQPTYDHVHPARTIRFPNVTAPAGAPCGAALQGLRPLGPPSGALALADACSIGYLVKPHRPAFGCWPPANLRVERRLTATLQLQPSSTTQSRQVPGAEAPVARQEEGAARSWWSFDR